MARPRRSQAVVAPTANNDVTVSVILENREVPFSGEQLAVTMDSSADDILAAVSGAVREAHNIDISRNFKVRKLTESNKICIIPETTAGK